MGEMKELREITADVRRTHANERVPGEFPCLLEQRIRPDRRYVRIGIVLTILLHGSLFGYTLYDSYRTLSSWRSLIGLAIVSEPGRWQGIRLSDRTLLLAPLYYPPGLLVSSSDEEAKRRAEERRRRQEAERRLREHMEQMAQANEAALNLPKTWEELEQRVKDEARKLNIGPIRDAIVEIYRAKQEGRLAFQDISVAVSFRVQKDGTLADIALVEPSGIPQVDAAALMIVEEASRARILTPLVSAQSVTVKLVIAETTELRFIIVSPSEAGAAQLVSQLNGLLLLTRLNAGKLDPQAVAILSRLIITQQGRNIIASVKLPRAEATEMLKSRIGSEE
ncbi:MAG: energy transducer TonB [Acidobacteriota bacterium]|nr:energy transducer TonB [Blastocatellia bacterium]MDW8168792.1 energy transducer TonB [Acidobacteriota bacterium]MDW8255669.1 energy transducer TonB [Acidobacteriota bacterium]